MEKLPGRRPRPEPSCFPRRRAARPRRPVPRGGRRLAAHGRRRWLRHQGERGDGQGCVDQALPPVRPGRAGRGRRHGCERQRLRIRLLVLQHGRSVGSATARHPRACSWGSRVLLALWAALCALWRSGRAARRPMVQAAAEQPASANSPDYYYTVLLPTASTIRTLTHPGAPTPRRRSATALSPSSRRPMASLSGSKSSTTWAPPSGSSTTLTTSRSTSRRPPPTAAGAPAGPNPMGSCTQTATTTRAP